MYYIGTGVSAFHALAPAGSNVSRISASGHFSIVAARANIMPGPVVFDIIQTHHPMPFAIETLVRCVRHDVHELAVFIRGHALVHFSAVGQRTKTEIAR